VAVAWTTYLLLVTWPICVYICGRLFSLSPWTAAGAAMASPFLSSAFSSGYEQRAYIFLGYQLWTQLFAMWCLPIAWGLTWRAIHSGKLRIAAGVAVGVTICMHFETGYLSVLPLLIWPWLVRKDLVRRLETALLVGATGLVVSSWAWVPLVAQKKWSGINSVLAGTNYQRGYGASRMLRWLFLGRIFDSGSAFAIISILAGFGLLFSLLRWRREPSGRAIVTIAVASLLLEFGTTTFGPLTDLIPGHQDLFFRRFAVGFQLAGLLLAGTGLTGLVGSCKVWISQSKKTKSLWRGYARAGSWTAAICVGAAVLAGLGASVDRVTSLDSSNGAAIASQVVADGSAGPSVEELVATMRSIGPGRVYAGTTTNWGAKFTVGEVPVYKYLEGLGVDVMVYSPTTTTLMDDPEFYFNQRNPGDYAVFGIRYLILPYLMSAPVAAQRVTTQGGYSLWQISGNGYGRVADTVGTVTENRANVGPTAIPFLDSRSPAVGDYATVAFEGSQAAAPTAPDGPPAGSPGTIQAQSDDPAQGRFEFRVHMNRRAVVVLSSTFDPGWQATVDGRKVPTEMIEPALVGVVVGSGDHTLVLAYGGYGSYLPLFAISFAFPVLVGSYMSFSRRRKRRSPVGQDPVSSS
jgi:hypothetical protein